MTQAYICDAIRTPIGRYGGALSSVRTDDLGAIPSEPSSRAIPKPIGRRVDDVVSTVAPTRQVKTIATSPAWPFSSRACPKPFPASR